MAFNLKSYENQAKLSVTLAVLGGIAALCVVALLARRFDRAAFFVTYNAEGVFLPVLAAGLLFAIAASTIGFFVALNSAGQRRNARSALSWKGFFLNALVITIVLAAALFFLFTRNAVTVKP